MSIAPGDRYQGLRAGWALAPLIGLVLLAGCNLVENLENNPSPDPEKVLDQDLDAKPYPNLAEVPDKAPPVTPEQIRANTVSGLEADRSNAQYSQPLTASGTAVRSAQPPALPPLDDDSDSETLTPSGTSDTTSLSAVSQSTTAVAAAGVPDSARPGGTSVQPSGPATPSTPRSPSSVTPRDSSSQTPGAAALAASRQQRGSGGATVAATQQSVPTSQTQVIPPQGSVGAGNVQMVAVIFFANGSDALDASDATVLSEVAKIQRQYGGILRVIGHASSQTGEVPQQSGELANLDISFDRAEAVSQALQRAGVPADRVVAEGLSDRQPRYAGATPSGQAGDRRAEIFLEY